MFDPCHKRVFFKKKNFSHACIKQWAWTGIGCVATIVWSWGERCCNGLARPWTIVTLDLAGLYCKPVWFNWAGLVALEPESLPKSAPKPVHELEPEPTLEPLLTRKPELMPVPIAFGVGPAVSPLSWCYNNLSIFYQYFLKG